MLPDTPQLAHREGIENLLFDAVGTFLNNKELPLDTIITLIVDLNVLFVMVLISGTL